MPINTYPNKIKFKTENQNGEKTQDNSIDFGQKMINAIDVQLIDTNIYMSKELWLPFGSRGAFGGQIVGQALNAAWDTLENDFFVHIQSLHAYFILACNAEIPVIYNIQRTRDGRSFATRVVTATQKGRAIFVCSCSFVKPEKGFALNHQTEMPKVVDPDTLPSDLELLTNTLQNADKFPERFRQRAKKKLEDQQPVDYREVEKYTHEEIVTGNVKPNAYNKRWFKTRGTLNDDMRLHACIIAYASDSGFINTAAKANGVTFNSNSIGMMTSLDHSIWFHMPSRADEFLLYDIHSPRTLNGRGIAFGRIYNRQGQLIATTAQEGILRLSEHEQKKRAQENTPSINIKNDKQQKSRL